MGVGQTGCELVSQLAPREAAHAVERSRRPLIGAAVTLAAYRIMVRIGRLPEDERVQR